MFNRSITQKISWLSGITSFIFLSLLISLLYSGFVFIINKSNKQFLMDEVNEIKSFIESHPHQIGLLKNRINWTPSNLRKNKIDSWISPYDYIRILDKDKNILLETPGMNKIIKVNKLTNVFGAKNKFNSAPSVRWQSPDQHYYLLVNTSIPLKINQGDYQLQIALDITGLEKAFSTYRRLLLIALLLAAIFSALLSQFIAKKSLKSLKEITDFSKRISIDRLDQKIQTKHWPVELQSLATTLNATLLTIRNRYNTLSQFSSDLAHELRTPIHNLIGQTEVTLGKTRDVGEYQKILSSNLDELSHLTTLIDKLLLLARADHSNIHLEKSTFNIADEFQLSCDYFNILAEEKNINLSHHGDIWLLADLTLFRQALNNLIDNAIKYTHKGGEVNLRSTQEARHIKITISDNGIGIEKNRMDNLFNRFYRIKHGKINGSGLGLAITQSIMKLHKGSISIESNLHQSTTVTLRFPKK
jgi:two-component system, OmpR family, heavy metal sensor histidine kinase CusS